MMEEWNLGRAVVLSIYFIVPIFPNMLHPNP